MVLLASTLTMCRCAAKQYHLFDFCCFSSDVATLVLINRFKVWSFFNDTICKWTWWKCVWMWLCVMYWCCVAYEASNCLQLVSPSSDVCRRYIMLNNKSWTLNLFDEFHELITITSLQQFVCNIPATITTPSITHFTVRCVYVCSTPTTG